MKRIALTFLWLITPLLHLFLTPLAHAEAEGIDLKALAKKARPAVVLLVVSDVTGKEIATGTGFFVSADGKLVTNYHVIEGGASVVAKAENGGKFEVEGVPASDPKNDLVLLKAKGKDLPFLTVGKSDKIEVGTRVAVIGSPLGLEGTLSEGILSAVRDFGDGHRNLQITAAISPGSSGSPVLNARGQVIGVASAMIRNEQMLNFAVPIELVNDLLAQSTTSVVGLGSGPITRRRSGSAMAIEPALDEDSDYVEYLRLIDRREYVAALKQIKVVVGRYPQSSKVYVELGRVYSFLNFRSDAVAACSQAIKFNPENAEAWHILGLSATGNDAIIAFRQAIKLQPEMVVVWRDLALSYVISGQDSEAAHAYSQALHLRPLDDFLLGYLCDAENGRTKQFLLEFIKNEKKMIRNDPEGVPSLKAWLILVIMSQNNQCARERIDLPRFCEEIIKANSNPSKQESAWLCLASEVGNRGRLSEFFKWEKLACR